MFVDPRRVLPYLSKARIRMPRASIVTLDGAAIRDFASDVATRLGHQPTGYDLHGSVGRIRCRACGQLTTCDAGELRVSGALVRERCGEAAAS